MLTPETGIVQTEYFSLRSTESVWLIVFLLAQLTELHRVISIFCSNLPGLSSGNTTMMENMNPSVMLIKPSARSTRCFWWKMQTSTSKKGETAKTWQCKYCTTSHLQISPLLIFKWRLMNYECCNYCMVSSQTVLMNPRMNFREQTKRPAADLEHAGLLQVSRKSPNKMNVYMHECVFCISKITRT